MAAKIPTPKTLLGEPEEYTGTVERDSVIVHVLGFEQMTRESFCVTLQVQVTLTGGKDPEGLPVGFFLNGIMIGKTTFDDFGVADVELTIAWTALEKGRTLTVNVKGMKKAVPVAWDVPKSPIQLKAERIQPILDQIIENMVNIPAGTFWMGQTDEEVRQQNFWNNWWSNDERPCHQVELSAFAISRYPVTQMQWQKVMGSNPSRFKGEDLPVESVAWRDAQAFCKKLSSTTDKTFRLPTEAEWEYACRAGTQTIWPFGNDPLLLKSYAWFVENSEAHTHSVGQLKSNEWGLYDILGNVWEWCLDWYDESYYANSPKENPQGASKGQHRLLRGGSWQSFQRQCRPASRSKGAPNDNNWFIIILQVWSGFGMIFDKPKIKYIRVLLYSNKTRDFGKTKIGS